MGNCIIYCSVPNEFTADLIATTLIDEKLAACINVLPKMKSIYRWEDSIQRDEELLMIIKTQSSKFNIIEQKIKELHEYSLPEIIAVPIIAGSSEYIQWINNETNA